ncbi:galactokinase [Gramella sp. BOM4]|nr:galactokinase [Christiangramia bathymodioli]
MSIFENPEHTNFDLEVSSPGRINFIGEHTDYNQGFVLPTAIDKRIYLKFRKNDTSNCRIYSETFQTGFEFDLEKELQKGKGWENYILGVVDQIIKLGKKPGGFDCSIQSELPVGAGISSSAALECGVASGLNELFDLGLSKMEIVKLSQKAENEFVGNNCGIMDQYASVMSKKAHLIMLDCQSMEAEYIPADFRSCKLLLLNTNVSHNLAESEYNTRRKECEKAVALIQKDHNNISSLREVSPALLEQYKDLLGPVIYSRCTYVLQENERVVQATDKLRKGKLKEFGQLMYASHEGLQHNYEVSCPELDFLVDYSRDRDFIYGSRMMGGGFGGCTLNLIDEDKIESYIEEVSKAYYQEFQINLDAISVSPDAGTLITKKEN